MLILDWQPWFWEQFWCLPLMLSPDRDDTDTIIIPMAECIDLLIIITDFVTEDFGILDIIEGFTIEDSVTPFIIEELILSGH